MKSEQRNLAWTCLASAVAHGALIFLIAVNFGGMLGANSQKDGSEKHDSKESGSQEISAGNIEVEILPKPTDVKQEEKLPEVEVFETEVMAADCPHFFGGIGVTHQLFGLIIEVPAGYPAARAGILPGDILKGDTKYIRGEIGTVVKVIVIRGKKTLKFSIIREKICITE